MSPEGDIFDPYHKWLGIPQHEQPPDHYRLLGIERFESDPDVIAFAADQRMAHVRTFQSGPRSALSQQILNEIAAARVCLLDPHKKAAYDQQLRARLAGSPPKPEAVPSPAEAVFLPTPPSASPSETTPVPPLSEVYPLPARTARDRMLFWQTVGILLALVAVLAVGGWIWLGEPSPKEAKRPTATKPQPPDRPLEPEATPQDGSPAEEASGPATADVPEAEPPADPAPTVPAGPQPTDLVGRGGGARFDDLPQAPALLVGFQLTFGNYAGHKIVKSIQPIYSTPSGTVLSNVYGHPSGESVSVTAKAGYAVGGIVAKGGYRLDGLKILFMRVAGDRLDPEDVYESPWLGGQGGGKETLLAGDGNPVVGIYGYSGSDIDGVGLVQLLDRSVDFTACAQSPAVSPEQETQVQEALAAARTPAEWWHAAEGALRLTWQMAPERRDEARRLAVQALQAARKAGDADLEQLAALTIADPQFAPSAPALANLSPPAPAKSPLPDTEVLDEAVREVRRVFEKEYDKPELASQLLNTALQENDPAYRLALLFEARQLSVRNNDRPTAFQVADKMSEWFGIDALNTKAELLEDLCSKAETPEQSCDLAEQAFLLMEQAVELDRPALAQRLAELAQSAAEGTPDLELRERTEKGAAAAAAVLEAWQACQEPLATLAERPDDPGANRIVGEYYAFFCGAWDRGLPKLALGDDERLRELALAELQGANAPEAQTALADGWYELAAQRDGPARERLEQRAAHWYGQAVRGLAGLRMALAAKRLEELQNRRQTVCRVTFSSQRDLCLFVQPNAEANHWAVKNTLLLIQGKGKEALTTYAKYFKSISSVTIRGTIYRPSTFNFCAAVGPIQTVLNWDQRDANLFFNGRQQVEVGPRALTPGKFCEITFTQEGDQVHVAIDGRRCYSTQAILEGTVTVFPLNSIIAIQQITVEGEVDPTRPVAGPSHPIPF